MFNQYLELLVKSLLLQLLTFKFEYKKGQIQVQFKDKFKFKYQLNYQIRIGRTPKNSKEIILSKNFQEQQRNNIKKMFYTSSLYHPQQLLIVNNKSVYQRHPELYVKEQIVLTQRDLIKNIIYMIYGLENQVFTKVCHQYQQSIDKFALKQFSFVFRQDYRIVLKHLTNETIKKCIQAPVKLANMISHLKTKAILIYEQTKNAILKSFFEGILQFVIRFVQKITNILTRLQQESGNVNLTNIYIFSQMQSQGQQMPKVDKVENITLLKITTIFQQELFFIEEFYNLINKILSYVSQSELVCETTDYSVIQIIFDSFKRMMDSMVFNQYQLNQVVAIFSNSLKIYLNLIKDWIQMNPYLLESHKQMPFFIKLSDINFSLSKSSTATFQKFTSTKLQKQNLISKSFNPGAKSSHLISIKQKSFSNDQFIEMFFKLDNLLVFQYLPQIFINQAQSILQLGKIIQFVYLFYETEEKQLLKQYFNVQKQFQILFQVNQKYLIPNQNKINNKNMINNQNKVRDTMFAYNKKNDTCSISEKIKVNANKKKMQFIKIKQDNPYEMFPLTRGTFVTSQTQFPLLKSQTQKNSLASSKNIIQNKQKAISQNKRQKISSNRKQIGNVFSIEFEQTLQKVIGRIYRKAVYFFQQQSNKDYFKINSHFDMKLKPLSKNLFQTLNNVSLFGMQNESNFFKTRNNNSMLSRISYQSDLGLIQLDNKQRIISAITSTLIGIKKFMLYQQGDFILELINQVNHLFESSYNKISKSLVNSHIEEAIRNSSAAHLPSQITQNVSFLFLNPTSNSEVKHLKGWTVFSLLYQPQFPMNCLFNNQIMIVFAEIFNFIFKIKKFQHDLKSIWQDFKEDAKIQTQYSLFQSKRHPYQYKILALRNNIHHFINAVYSYVMIQIQGYWQEYIKQINISIISSSQVNSTTIAQTRPLTKEYRKNHNPISLINLTLKLQKNLKQQTTQNQTLFNTIIVIKQILDKFKKLLTVKPDSKDWDQFIFKRQIQFISQQFIGVMEMAKNIDGVGEIVEYNSHQNI